MLIYLIFFIITIIFSNEAQKCLDKNKNKKAIFYSILVILFPTILAGVRADNVGTDVNVYVKRFFSWAFSYDSFIKYNDITNVETGYNFITYFVSRFSNDVHVLFFINQLIISSCIYLFSLKKRNDVKMWIVQCVYLFCFYNISLNIVRQSIAISIVLYSIALFDEKKYLKACIIYLLALTFHNSVLLAIPIYIFLVLFNKNRRKEVNIILVILFEFSIIATIFYADILKILSQDLNIISTKYFDYLNNTKFVNTEINMNFTGIVYRFIWLCPFLVLFKKIENKEKIYFMCLVFELLIFFISFRITNVTRVGLYYSILGTIGSISFLFKHIKNDRINRIFSRSIIIVILILFWFYNYIVLNSNETYPYKSDVIECFNILI